MSNPNIKAIQKDLISLGLLAVGEDDGLWGKKTQTAWDSAMAKLNGGGNTPNLDIAWSGSPKVSDAFIAKTKRIANDLKMPADGASWLMSCMAFETGETFSPSIQNFAGAQAFGLIQFMKDAATDVGSTLSELVKMTAEDQLEYVYKYFKRFTGKLNKLEDVYMAIFYPKAIGWDVNRTLFNKVSEPKAYSQNAGLDVNKDGNITVGEISSLIRAKHVKGMQPQNRRTI